MSLIDRLDHTGPPPEGGYILGHQFSATLWFLSKGDITRARVVSDFALSVTDQVQLDQIITFYGTLVAAEKAQFHSRVESGLMRLQTGLDTRAEFKARLGMT